MRRPIAAPAWPRRDRRRRRLRLLRQPPAASSTACAWTASSAPTAPHAHITLTGAGRGERGTALTMLPRALRGGELVICDKGLRRTASSPPPSVSSAPPSSGPRAATRPTKHRDCRASAIFTCNDALTLERQGARTLHNLRARIIQRLLALTACIYLNHWLGRPSRALVDYIA